MSWLDSVASHPMENVCRCRKYDWLTCEKHGCEDDPEQVAWIEAIDAGHYDEIAQLQEEIEEQQEIIEWAGL